MLGQRSWYLIHTKPRMEKQAEENLNRQGYETYLPMITTRRRRNSRYINVIEAFFPRYLFIHLSSKTDNWAPIRSTLGVSRLIEFGGIAAMAPVNLVESLKARENNQGFQSVEKRKITKGNMVKVIDGPFIGYQGVCNKQKSAERVTVLLDIVGKCSELTICEHDLQLA